MIPEITQKNLYLLLPGKVTAVVEQYVNAKATHFFHFMNTEVHLFVKFLAITDVETARKTVDVSAHISSVKRIDGLMGV